MRINVLVVDDSAFMRRAISKMLEGEPEIVVCGTARTGEEAVLKAQQLAPDVVTMDVEMPGMGGLEAVREIASHSDIPVIMISSLTQEGAETTFRALDAGAVDFIPKPDAAYANIKDVARELVAKVRVFARRGAGAQGAPRARKYRRRRRSRPYAALAMRFSSAWPSAPRPAVRSRSRRSFRGCRPNSRHLFSSFSTCRRDSRDRWPTGSTPPAG